MKYIITVCRISRAFHDIEVEADIEVNAVNKALNDAGNHKYSERTADYEVTNVRISNEPEKRPEHPSISESRLGNVLDQRGEL